MLKGTKIMSTLSRAWSISFAIHLGLASVIGGYLVTQGQSFKELTGVDIPQTVNTPPKPQVQKPVIKPVKSRACQLKARSSLNRLKSNKE